jgi:PTS system nitrogen regulatory IIA component
VKLLDFLGEEHIVTDIGRCDKFRAIECLVDRAVKVLDRVDKSDVLRIIMEREELGSTGIGGGVAIPHGKLPQLDRMTILVGRSREGVDFDAIDNAPVNIIFLLLAPDDAATVYLKVLARISKMLKREGVLARLLEVEDESALLATIDEIDSLSL